MFSVMMSILELTSLHISAMRLDRRVNLPGLVWTSGNVFVLLITILYIEVDKVPANVMVP